jgi:hypothetical protein
MDVSNARANLDHESDEATNEKAGLARRSAFKV